MIDLTYNIEDKICLFPGSQKYISSTKENSSSFIVDSHYGTHIDAPSHFIENGRNISEINHDMFFGKVQIITIKSKIIDKDLLKSLKIKLDRVFFNCIDNDMLKPFNYDYAALNESGAKYIVKNNIKMVGINYVSIERFYNNDYTQNKKFLAHKKLLKNNVLIVEGLKLSNVKDGIYEYVLLPLKTYKEASLTRIFLKSKLK